MSVSGHAYRHALQRAPSRFDYVWISDELLSLTFQRFAKGQRRYGSRVPGPLEASRRLAKRRNTALAGAGGSFDSPANVAHLFGANGKGHVRQWDDSPWSSRWPEPLELFSYSDQPPLPPSPAFLTQTENPKLSTSEFPGNAIGQLNAENPTFESSLSSCSNIQDVKEALEWYQIDLRKEPEISRMIFDHFYRLISGPNQVSAVHELVEFMNNTSLNIYGVGNYGGLFNHPSASELDSVYETGLIDVATKAIGLGLVPIAEINQILQLLPAFVCGDGSSCQYLQPEALMQAFRGIWQALQSCTVFKLHEIYDDLLEPWVDQLISFNESQYLHLAKDILIAYYETIRNLSYSVSLRALHVLSSTKVPIEHDIFNKYLDRALMLGDEVSLCFARDAIINYHRFEPKPLSSIVNILLQHLIAGNHSTELGVNTHQILPALMRQLNVDLSTQYIILITEGLAFAHREDLLRGVAFKNLQNCLSHINRPAMLLSPVWSELTEYDSLKVSKGLRVALRMWTWSALYNTPHRRSTRLRSGYLHPRQEDVTGIAILKLFDDVTTSTMWQSRGNRTELFPKLITGLQRLDIPSNQVLRKVYTILSHREIENISTLQSFRKLEEGLITLEQAATQRHVFNSTKHYLLSSHLRIIENIDVTSETFTRNMVEMIENDNKKIRDIIFLISFHTPLKIALAMASTRIADRSIPDTKRVKAIMRLESKGKQLYLEPHACVAFIHLLATSIAVSDKVSPRAAFNLISHLYRYLNIHNAPIKPSFVRAMYHCGVTRFAENGLRVSGTQQDYILQVVRRYEDPETARGLLNGSFLETVR